MFESLFSKGNNSKGNGNTTSNNKKPTGAKAPTLKNNNTAQKTIPYLAAYDDGIIETKKGFFSKTYFIQDTNFDTLSQDMQNDIFFNKYSNLLNLFGSEAKAEFTVFNRNIDRENFEKNILIEMKGDNLDKYREEQNAILLENMRKGKNNITKELYITVTIEAESYDKAITIFNRYDTEINNVIKPINVTGGKPLNLKERMSILYDIYHLDDSGFLNKEAVIDGINVSAFDVKTLKEQGVTTKDVIAPAAFKFDTSNFMIDDFYGQTIYLEGLPNYLSTNFIGEINNLPFNMLSSIHFDGMKREAAIKMVKAHLLNINADVVKRQQQAYRNGYSADMISPTLKQASDEAQKTLDDVSSRNQKLFYTTLVITHFAKDKDELDTQKNSILAIGQKYLVNLKVLTSQQEYGLNASLPIGVNELATKKTLTTESASLFMPFNTQELFDYDGIYYGLNSNSKNLVLYDRRKEKNGNGLILGTPGSGKSFAAKREMLSVLLNTDADVYVVDPEGEYTALAAMLGGEVVKISIGSGIYINPLDMDMDYANEGGTDNQDPVTLKADFVTSLCETILGGKFGLSVTQQSIIDRCVRTIYKPYVNYMLAHPELGTSDNSKAPTLKHLYNELLKQEEPEARVIALALERFVTGSLDVFSNRTNVDIKKRFVVYNIVNIGKGLKELGLQVCLNDVWNRTIANAKKNKRTWFYLDEFYLLTQTESSAIFLQEIFKRARKWGGMPTGITQNVEDLLSNKESRTILSNSNFVLMFNQAPNDRQDLAHLYNISPAQLQYVTNAPAGQGLMYTGKTIVPFIDEYPRDTKSFLAMTSSMTDKAKQAEFIKNTEGQIEDKKE